MQEYLACLFEDVKHEWLLIILLSLTEERIIKQSGITVYEKTILKNLASEKLHIHKTL